MDASSIVIVGLGGAGGRIVSVLADTIGAGPSVVAIDTDMQALETTRAATKLVIGDSVSGGMGTGGSAELGQRAAESEAVKIQNLCVGKSLVLLVAGLGGGTGSGAAPVLLRAAREAGAKTLCVAALPFDFEGQERSRISSEAVLPIRDASDVLLAIPNERLAGLVDPGTLAETFDRIDDIVAHALQGIWRILTQPGTINRDFADLERLAESAGVATLSYGEGQGENRAEAAVDALLSNPLTGSDGLLSEARHVLVHIVGGSDLGLAEVNGIMARVTAAAGSARVLMGAAIDADWGDRLTVTLVVSDEQVAASPRREPLPRASVPEVEPRQRRSRRKSASTQDKLRFDLAGKGRFKNSEPTILDGEDWDIPTYVRRGIVLEG